MRDMRDGVVTELSYSIQSALRSRTQVKDRIDQYGQALTRLQQEQRQYEQRAVQAKQTATNAAIQVMRITAEQHVEEIEILEARAAELRTSLISLSRVWVQHSGQPKPIPLSPRIVAIIHEPVVQVTDSDPMVVSRWQDTLAALLVDPDTEI